MLFLLRPLTKPCYCDVTMHALFFCRGREVKHSDESDKKEGKGKGKWTIGPWMKNGRTNLCSFCAQTNGPSCVLKLVKKHKHTTQVNTGLT